MTTVYCKRNKNEMLDFYIEEKGEKYYLFPQKPYKGVENYYKKGVSLEKAINHGLCGKDHMIHKVMSKLPAYIRYVEKEYGIAVFEQSKRKLELSA